MSDRDELELRKQLAKLEVPKMVIWVDSDARVETTNLVEKTIDEIVALFDQVSTRRAAEAVGLTETDRFDRLTALQKKRLIEYHTDCLRRLQPTKGSKDE